MGSLLYVKVGKRLDGFAIIFVLSMLIVSLLIQLNVSNTSNVDYYSKSKRIKHHQHIEAK